MELTEIQKDMVRKLLECFEEENLYVIAGRHKDTGRISPVLVVVENRDGQDIPIPVAVVFTPYEDYPLDTYIFPTEEEEGESIDGLNFNYKEKDTEEKKSLWGRFQQWRGRV